MWVIRVGIPDNDDAYYNEQEGFVDYMWQGTDYANHSDAVEMGMKLSRVFKEYRFVIVRV